MDKIPWEGGARQGKAMKNDLLLDRDFKQWLRELFLDDTTASALFENVASREISLTWTSLKKLSINEPFLISLMISQQSESDKMEET